MTDNACLIELLQTCPPSQRDSNVLQELKNLLLNLGMVVQKESDLLVLCREVDVAVVDKGSLIYMQGEAAGCYFVVLRGAVDLYYEHDCAVEGRLLQQLAPYDLHVEPQDGMCIFGQAVTELQVGSGFGEDALLAGDNLGMSPSKGKPTHNSSPRAQNKVSGGSSKKGRPADAPVLATPGQAHSAVSAAADTALLVIPASTYRKVVQKLHSAQQEAAAAAVALWRLPLLRHGSFASALQVALRAQPELIHHKVLVAGYHAPIDRVYLVLDGEVRVSGAPTSPQRKLLFEGSSSVGGESIATSSLAESSMSAPQKFPPVTISVLRAGQVVGETEVHRGLSAFKFNYEVLSLHARLLVIPVEVYLECVRDCAFNNPGGVVFSAAALTEEEAMLRMQVRTARCAEIDAMARGLRKQQRSGLSGPPGSLTGGASLDSCSAGMLSDFASPGRPARPPGQSLGSVQDQSSSLWSTPQQARALAGAAMDRSTNRGQQQSPRAVQYGDPVSASPRQWAAQGHMPAVSSPRPPRSPKSPRPGALTSYSPRQTSPRQFSPRQVSPSYLRGGQRAQHSGAGEPAVPESVRSFEDGADTYASIAIVEAHAMAGTATVPNQCMDYAVTPAEASRRVREELQAIRARLAVKSTSSI